MNISELKPLQDREIVLRLKDGEVLRAKVKFVDLEYEDIIVDIVHTNQPEHSRDRGAAYTVAASEIDSVEMSN